MQAKRVEAGEARGATRGWVVPDGPVTPIANEEQMEPRRPLTTPDAAAHDTAFENVQWAGSGYFAVLAHRFFVRWSWPDAREIRVVLGAFEQAPGGAVPAYSLLSVQDGGSERYKLFYGSEQLWSAEHPFDVLDHLYWCVNEGAFRQTDNFLLVHSGVVLNPNGGVVLLPGASGSGKTTLVAGLVTSGFGYLSDEAAVIQPSTGLVDPFPKALSIKGSLRDVLPELAAVPEGPRYRHQWHLDPDLIRLGARAGSGAVELVVLPKYVRGAEVEITPMSRATVLTELVRHVMNAHHFHSRSLPILADVVRNARAYRLVFGDVSDGVDAVTTLVARS